VLLAAAVLLHLGLVLYLSLPVVDDAAISIAYGQSFWNGDGLRLTPESAVVEGYSNPLWVLLTGVTGPLHVDPLKFTQILGVLFGLLGLVGVAFWGPLSVGRRLQWEDGAGALLVAMVPNYAFWSSSGMESGLQSALLVFGGALGLQALRRGHGVGAGLLLGALFWVRPEAPLYLAVAALVWSFFLWKERRRPTHQEWLICALVLLFGLTLYAGRWLYFRDVFPNTYYAKRFWEFAVGRYLQQFGQAHAWILLTAGALSVVGLALGRSQRRTLFLCLGWLWVGIAFVVSSRGDWMAEWRFLAPLWPLVGVCCAAGLTALRSFSGMAPLAACLLFAAATVTQVPRVEVTKRSAEFAAGFVLDESKRLEQALEQLNVRRARVGVADIGGAGLALRKHEIVDVAGLADVAVAKRANHYPAIDEYLVPAGRPDIVDAHGPSGHLRTFASLMANYQPYRGPLWILRGLTRTQDPRCPEGKAAVLGMTPSDWLAALNARLSEDDAVKALALWRCVQAHADPLPMSPQEQERLWKSAETLARRQLAAGNVEKALRNYSFAAVVSGKPGLRQRTETLRAQLFPRRSEAARK